MVERTVLVLCVVAIREGQGDKRNGLVLCGAAPGVGQRVGFR